MSKAFSYRSLLLVLTLLVLGVNTGKAQTTEFTYQGKLVDGALPANANYDFEFRLFSTDSVGSAIATQTRLGVPVGNGVFTVKLDFGGQFDGNARWLEIAVKPAGSPNPLTVLTPRQPITSAPYSIRSLSSERADVATNSLQLGGVNASQYVLTTDSRMTDARNPLPNSANYVQNSTSQQSSTNFNISGDGRVGGTLSAGAISTNSQYNIFGERVLGAGGGNNLFVGSFAGSATSSGEQNTFAGTSAGRNNTTGNNNAFFGAVAAFSNTTGSQNSVFGSDAGRLNTAGNGNSIFGYGAGRSNTASFNSFFGSQAGISNTGGNENSFFGAGAGDATTGGDDNSFFGRNAGSANTTGNSNAFFGFQAGNTNTTGSNNTIIGTNADVNANNLTFATAIGAGATVGTSNTLVLGRGSDRVRVIGFLNINTFDSAGTISVCLNGAGNVSGCSSSLRYKTGPQTFSGGLDIVRRLRPISFNWRDGGMRDVGFGAEDVEKVEPLLVTYNAKGEIEGVKYGQLTTVLVNAIKEQQAQIRERESQAAIQEQQIEQYRKQLAAQQTQLTTQQREIEPLKQLLCRSHPKAAVCKNIRRTR